MAPDWCHGSVPLGVTIWIADFTVRARREEGAYWWYATDEQRRPRGKRPVQMVMNGGTDPLRRRVRPNLHWYVVGRDVSIRHMSRDNVSAKDVLTICARNLVEVVGDVEEVVRHQVAGFIDGTLMRRVS